MVVCTYEQEEVGHLGEPKAKCALKVFVCLFGVSFFTPRGLFECLPRLV